MVMLVRFVSILAVVVMATGSHKQVCNDVPPDQLRKQLQDGMDLHPSFYIFPPLLQSVKTFEMFNKTNSEMVSIKTSPINYGQAGSSDCKNETCPTNWVFNYDVNRVPSTVVEAKCQSCSSCLGQTNTRCLEVHTYYPVLRRQKICNSGFYQYEKVYEPVSVGCACKMTGRLGSEGK